MYRIDIFMIIMFHVSTPSLHLHSGISIHMNYYEYPFVDTTAYWISEERSSIPTNAASSQFIQQDSRLLESSASTQEYSVHPLPSPESNAVKLLPIRNFIKICDMV